MDNFLNTCHLIELNQDQISNLKRHIARKEIEAVIKSLKNKKKKWKWKEKKSQGPDCLATEFYQILKEELTPILL